MRKLPDEFQSRALISPPSGLPILEEQRRMKYQLEGRGSRNLLAGKLVRKSQLG